MFILVDTEIIEIINKPITKDVYAINEIIFLFLKVCYMKSLINL